MITVVASVPKHKETIKEKCIAIDLQLKSGMKSMDSRNEDEWFGVRNEKDLLKIICPGARSEVYRKSRRVSRKRRVCRSWTYIEDNSPQIDMKEDDNQVRYISIPKCMKCLHDDVKCKYRDTMLNTLASKIDIKRKGSYRFRLLLRKICGSKWFDEFVILD